MGGTYTISKIRLLYCLTSFTAVMLALLYCYTTALVHNGANGQRHLIGCCIAVRAGAWQCCLRHAR